MTPDEDGRPAKQMRRDLPDSQRAWLARVQLPDVISPGTIRISRAVCRGWVDTEQQVLGAVMANRCSLYAHEISAPPAGSNGYTTGKEGVLIPGSASGASSARLQGFSLRSEVMSLALRGAPDGSQALAAVDGYGDVLLCRLAPGSPAAVTEACALTPPAASTEPGWAGVAFAPSSPLLATARHFSRTLDVYDGDLHARAIHTAGFPSALVFAPSLGGGGGDAMLAVSEANQVVVFDLRTSGGCVARVRTAGAGRLDALAVAPAGAAGAAGGLLAAGGSERDIHVYDPRTWHCVKRWMGVTRQGITALDFCAEKNGGRFVFVAALDGEVLCRALDVGASQAESAGRGAGSGSAGAAGAAGVRSCSFRGDSRWVGFGRAPGGDEVVAATSGGGLYAAAGLTRLAERGKGGGGAAAAVKGSSGMGGQATLREPGTTAA